jgi:hypothetical protein
LIYKLARSTAFILLFQPMQRADAQSPGANTARLDSARAVLLSIPLESPIRVVTVGHSIIDGRLSSRSDTGVVIRHRHNSSHASIARIAEIYRPAASLKSGAIIGGITGGVLGSLALGTLAAGLCEINCHGAFANGATIGAALGGAVGAFVGVIAGSFVHHWERVWPPGVASTE